MSVTKVDGHKFDLTKGARLAIHQGLYRECSMGNASGKWEQHTLGVLEGI